MKILVLGVSVRAMVASAMRSGYAVLALDAFGDQDLRSIAEAYAMQRDFNEEYSPGALCRACERFVYDAVAYTANLENHANILKRIAGNRRIIGNLPQTLRSVRDWPTLAAKLEGAGFSIPKTIFSGQKTIPDSSRAWLIKPVLSGGGHGVIVQTRQEFPGENFMLQEYISGKPCSASFVANGRECVVLGITEQLIGMPSLGSHGFRYCGNILPLHEMTDPDEGRGILYGVQNLAAFLTREYGLTGVNGIDFILKGRQIYLIEVNPRYSASMELVEQAYGLPIFDLLVHSALQGRLPDFRLQDRFGENAFLGKAIIFAERNAVARDTKGWLDRGARDVPAEEAVLENGQPVCTVFASRKTREETLADLIQKAAQVKDAIYA
jgi:predicted ATP-grasp superfamily ATP-dependent carboligase